MNTQYFLQISQLISSYTHVYVYWQLFTCKNMVKIKTYGRPEVYHILERAPYLGQCPLWDDFLVARLSLAQNR
jgi:hypothetical protein